MTTILFAGVAPLTMTDLPVTAEGFYFNELTDWYAGAESKSAVNERAQADGAFGIGTDWRSSLAVTIGGYFLGDTPEAAVLASESLSSINSGGRKVPVAVTDSVRTTSRSMSVRLVSIPDFKGRASFTFTIDMIAADPLRYGVDQSVTTGPPMSGGGLLFPLGTTPTAYWDFGADGQSGRVSVTNDGTAAVWPTLTATGGMSGGFVATNVTTGATVRFERPIPDDSVVSVNQRTGRASIDGQSDVSGFITQREFFSVPAGATHQVQFSVLGSTSGTPQFGLSYAPAYL